MYAAYYEANGLQLALIVIGSKSKESRWEETKLMIKWANETFAQRQTPASSLKEKTEENKESEQPNQVLFDVDFKPGKSELFTNDDLKAILPKIEPEDPK